VDTVYIGVILIGALVICFFIGIPIAYSLGLVGLVGLISLYGFEGALDMTVLKIWSFVGSFTFTAIPLFILMGFYALYAGLTKDAFEAARVWLGKLPGGLASAVVLASALFAACSGSGLPATVALGRIAVPEMIDIGYDKRLATGVVAASTPLAVLIPPSIIMILFGILTETSIARLLIAGILPGILAATVFIIGITLLTWRRPQMAPPYPGVITWRLRFTQSSKVLGIVVLFVLVIGSIYLGWATPTEAAGFGACGALLLALGLRRLGWRDFKQSLYETLYVSGFLFLIIAMASIFIIFMVRSGVVEVLATFLIGLEVSPIMLMVILSVLYIILGMFIDSISMMVMTIPIIYPVLVAMDINLIWFGILMVIWIEIAAITPPFGICVYALKGALGEMIDLWDIFRGCFFFLGLWILILGICIVFPQISLWLPGLMKGA